MAETYQGEFYCVKCKEKREAEGEVAELEERWLELSESIS